MDGICLRTGIHHHGINPAISVSGYLDGRPSPSQVSAVGRTGSAEKSLNTNLFSRFSFRYPLKSLWPGGGSSGRYNGLAVDDAVMVENGERKAIEENVSAMGSEERQNENWVLKILHVRALWGQKRVNTSVNSDNVKIDAAQAVEDEEEAAGADCAVKDQENDCHFDEEEEACDDCRVDFDVDHDDIQLDRNSFSRLLRRVSLAEARLYAQMCYLGSLAYSIPKIEPGNLLQQYGLRFVTSSIEKKELAAKTEKDQMLTKSEKQESNDKEEKKAKKTNGYRISASAAHEIAASAAVYLHSRTKSILPFKSSKVEVGESALEGRHETSDVGNIQEEVASFIATTDSVTAVVAAKEEVKQAVADDLKSTTSSPCEWFVCDDESGTRFFVIQGSETLQSWQANLLFEPVKFEGMDVPVHRGIYEAAKGIYEQMLPEVQSHLKSHGDCATFRFTGHSLGGSLAVLVNLMLLIRQEVPVTSLLPVVTFGAPSIMCGGDNLLSRLGLPQNHVQAITMHRDIVPRAFSCNYPGHVAELLKAINGNFRTHPCLNNKKLLYAPMGELLILQPDEKFSPHHHLLPSGSGLYLMSPLTSESNDADKHLMAAKLVFLNSPHPLEILSDRSAYGSDGTIQRDHDMNSYLKSLRSVIRQELNHIRRLRREQRRKMWWPLVSYQRTDSDVVFGRELVSAAMRHDQFNFSGILETGKQSMTRFSRLVASQHMHLLVVFTFPAKLLLLGTYGITRLR